MFSRADSAIVKLCSTALEIILMSFRLYCVVSFFFFFLETVFLRELDQLKVILLKFYMLKNIYAFYFSKQGDEEKKLVRWGRRANLPTCYTGSQILPVCSRLMSVPAAFCSICYLRPVPYLWAAEIRICALW